MEGPEIPSDPTVVASTVQHDKGPVPEIDDSTVNAVAVSTYEGNTLVSVPVDHKTQVVEDPLLVGSAPLVTVTLQQSVPMPPPVQATEEEEVGLIEVRDAMKEANEVFNRVKSEKIAEQALCSIRNDQQQYEGLAKEIVGKAIKQKERERANRASAAASRAKVMRYQTELESRLNRVESERNAFRKDSVLLKMVSDEKDQIYKQLQKMEGWFSKLEAANPGLVRSVMQDDPDGDYLSGEKDPKKPRFS